MQDDCRQADEGEPAPTGGSPESVSLSVHVRYVELTQSPERRRWHWEPWDGRQRALTAPSG